MVPGRIRAWQHRIHLAHGVAAARRTRRRRAQASLDRPGGPARVAAHNLRHDRRPRRAGRARTVRRRAAGVGFRRRILDAGSPPAVRPAHRAARPRAPVPGDLRRACPGSRAAPHRHRRLVVRRADLGTRHALHRVRPRRRATAARTARPIRRLRRLAAEIPRRPTARRAAGALA